MDLKERITLWRITMLLSPPPPPGENAVLDPGEWDPIDEEYALSKLGVSRGDP
jgi:hypothetical protein